MLSSDSFSQGHRALLEESYDVVDRLVLNAYFALGQSAGGFRMWWRRLHGSDATLDNTHLMRMAGRFSRRVRGWAKKHNIPVVVCGAGERKSEVAARYLPTSPGARGIFAVLVGRAPASVWEVERFGNGSLNLKRKKPRAWVNYYSFHLLDEEWGHLTIKLCGHPPFSAQVLLNGHEYVGCQARKAGLDFRKEGNCFTEVSNARGLAQVADTLRSPTAIGRLRQVCERWLYTCLAFGLSLEEQEKSGFRYSYSVYQAEYSRNLLFHSGRQMEEVFNGVIDHTRAPLNVPTIKTVFGWKNRPRRSGKRSRCEVAVERPEYDLTVFKVHFQRLTSKVYTKGERVLRIEAIAHNTADLRCGKVLEKYPDIVQRLAAMVERFLEVLHWTGTAWISEGTLENLPKPSRVGKTRVGGIDLNQLRMRTVMAAIVKLAPAPRGFSATELAAEVARLLGEPYRPRQAAYDLKKLRGKEWVTASGDNSRRYRATPQGLRAMAALATLLDKVIKPLLAGVSQPQPEPRDHPTHPVVQHYQTLRHEMERLFQTLGIAA
jgi:hypothetical protein